MAVKFQSIDKAARTATFEADGKAVVRRIPAQFVGTIDDYLAALATGLEVEFASAPVKTIGATSFKAGDEPAKAG